MTCYPKKKDNDGAQQKNTCGLFSDDDDTTIILKPQKSPYCLFLFKSISILPNLSKLVEKLLLKRLILIVNDNNTLSVSQIGFRNNHSTVHKVQHLVNKI